MDRPIRIFLTARDTGDRLAERPPAFWQADPAGEELRLVNVYDDVAYQEILGFGGALTEAAAVIPSRASAGR